ncbi:MAG: MMPL family transporter, partial [Candidatus Sericytochromatia bacterium]|nr:MMPL family transporter [Candidatus Tanganyikabacteria bacterium]
RALPGVVAVRALPSADPARLALAVGFASASLEAQEALVPDVRRAVHEVAPERVRALVTGHAALNADMVKLGSEQAASAEWRVLPLVLVALVLAFGPVGAAALPLVTGTAAVLVALGCLAILGRFVPLSILSSNVATMVGLALGIDYALFVVSRIREEGGAVGPAAARTGPVILTSVGTVLIGFAGLALVPTSETAGMGLGGLVVAAWSLLAALTLLPAGAALLGRNLDEPRALARPASRGRSKWWAARAETVVRHPWPSFALACLVLAALAWPIARFDLGFPGFGVAPRQLESVRALDIINDMRLGGALVPSQLVVRAPAGEPLLTRERMLGLAALSKWLEERPEVARVISLTGREANLNSLLLGVGVIGPRALPGHLPAEGRALMSRDGAATLVVAIPRADLDYGQVRDFNRLLRAHDWGRFEGLKDSRVLVGGSTAVELDFIALSRGALPWLGLFVLSCTFGSLYLLTRSLVIPLKAVLTNLLTVAATLGAATFLFQSPAASRLLGLPEPVMTVPALFPVMVFAVLFGLSMDYETFLIGRIQEAHEAGQDDARAVVAGVAASGGIITSTASIMAIVFAGFAACDLVPVKLLGTTLAIGIVLDATVTRLLLVPAAIVLLGRWNWWPARHRTAATRSAPTS